jgi:hypothetical protein
MLCELQRAQNCHKATVASNEHRAWLQGTAQDIRRSLWQIYHQDPPINGDFENLRRITVQSSPMTLPGVSNMIVEVRFRSWEFQRSVPRRRNFCSTKRFA